MSHLPRVSGRDVVKALTKSDMSKTASAVATSFCAKNSIRTDASSFPITRKLHKAL